MCIIKHTWILLLLIREIIVTYVFFYSFLRFTSPTSPARKPSSALPLPDSHSMDWNSLVNTATKAINTDEDETTLMDLESEQPTQKSTPRYENPSTRTLFRTKRFVLNLMP